jgi:beta-glucanase (GH16 family)
MKFLFLIAALSITSLALAAPPGDRKEWKLIFGDEFNGRALDTGKWSHNYPWGAQHNHLAHMDASHVGVANGKLVIRAVNERHPKATDTAKFEGRTLKVNYQAGAVHTSGKFDFTHGYAEARLKVPKGRGFWPAFWLLPTRGGWPPEIDVMEILTSNPRRSHVALHYGKSWRDHRSHGQWVKDLPDLSAEFHDYGVHWTRDFIDFYFDGKRVHRVSDRAAIAYTDTPMYLIINLAVGGWEKAPDETTVWERNYYEVDWVRVWQPVGKR